MHEKYEPLDIIAMDGAALIAKHDNPGLCAGDGRQGRAGRRGETGRARTEGRQRPDWSCAAACQF
jgi:hypothetical protein